MEWFYVNLFGIEIPIFPENIYLMILINILTMIYLSFIERDLLLDFMYYITTANTILFIIAILFVIILKITEKYWKKF